MELATLIAGLQEKQFPNLFAKISSEICIRHEILKPSVSKL